MRVLVTGVGGQVGTLVAERMADHQVLGTTHATMDLSSRESIEAVVTSFAPEVVINCGAYTDVDGCERNPTLAYAVNALGVRHLAIAAARVGAHVVHVSTDFVFDGTIGRPYREWDAPNPISEYGRSKLGGEQELAQHASSWAVARTAWVYGDPERDFVSWAVRAFARGELRGIADDQHGSPTWADDLAAALVQLAVRRARGLFHVANEGTASRWDQAVAALAALGLDATSIPRIESASLNRPAERPADSTLESNALAAIGVDPLRKWEDAINEYATGPLRSALGELLASNPEEQP